MSPAAVAEWSLSLIKRLRLGIRETTSNAVHAGVRSHLPPQMRKQVTRMCSVCRHQMVEQPILDIARDVVNTDRLSRFGQHAERRTDVRVAVVRGRNDSHRRLARSTIRLKFSSFMGFVG